MRLTESKRRVVAALIEARGNAARAAELAGVSRQYVYEVVKRLRGRGARLRGFPSLRALGSRAFIVFLKKGAIPYRDLAVQLLYLYDFKLRSRVAAIYAVPGKEMQAFEESIPSNAEVYEVVDVLPGSPWTSLTQLEVVSGYRLPLPGLHVKLDRVDVGILEGIYEDFMKPLGNSVEGLSRSTLSYHYRRHVKPILRVFLDPCPEGLHDRPLILSYIRAGSEETLASLLRARQVYALIPRPDRISAFALLDVEEGVFNFLKACSSFLERGRLDVSIRLMAYVDHELSWKLKLPRALKLS